MTAPRHRWWIYGRLLIVPLLLWALVIGSLWEPVKEWLAGSEAHDETILREWIEESRGNLRGMVEDYVKLVDDKAPPRSIEQAREKILIFLDTLGTPPTKEHAGTLPVFPTIFRIAVHVKGDGAEPIVWDSLLPTTKSDYEKFEHPLGPRAVVKLHYQFHAFDKRQREEELRASRFRKLGGLALLATLLAMAWMFHVQQRERDQQELQHQAEQQVHQAERARLEAEQRRQEAERNLLQQKLAAQEYEQKMLEMKSQLYANIGIMAGSYAHNIKNLLVRPNDLLRRCLEADGHSLDQTKMLQEVKLTLGTVTERLQQILHTVRRDPTHSEKTLLDLRELLSSAEQTWCDLAWERWKLQLVVKAEEGPLSIEGDLSHLQQTIENLLFNARDATFEMRLHLRDEARKGTGNEAAKRQALLEAAKWKGQVTIVARRVNEEVILEVSDNGIGMTDEVRLRCTETHFSTKRDNANYEGHSTGMGLGLSFVQMVLDNHGAKLEIDSAPGKGTTFRLRFQAMFQSTNAK